MFLPSVPSKSIVRSPLTSTACAAGSMLTVFCSAAASANEVSAVSAMSRTQSLNGTPGATPLSSHCAEASCICSGVRSWIVTMREGKRRSVNVAVLSPGP